MARRIGRKRLVFQEKWLKAFESIAKFTGDEVLFKIGLEIPRNAKFPDWIKKLSKTRQIY